MQNCELDKFLQNYLIDSYNLKHNFSGEATIDETDFYRDQYINKFCGSFEKIITKNSQMT